MAIQKIDQVFTVYRLDSEEVHQAIRDHIFAKTGELIPEYLQSTLVWDHRTRAIHVQVRQPGELAETVTESSVESLN